MDIPITICTQYYTQHILPWDSSPLKGGNFPSKTVLRLFGHSPNRGFDPRFRRRRLSSRFIGFRPLRDYFSQTRPLPHSKCEVWAYNSTRFLVCQPNFALFPSVFHIFIIPIFSVYLLLCFCQNDAVLCCFFCTNPLQLY